MFRAVARIFRTPDLRRKIGFTLGIVALFRLGSFIPAPFVDFINVQACLAGNAGASGLYELVNLEKLADLYPAGGDVTIADLVAKGAVRKNEKVKVLGDGDIAVKLNVAVDKVSGSAEQKIVAAGGSVK